MPPSFLVSYRITANKETNMISETILQYTVMCRATFQTLFLQTSLVYIFNVDQVTNIYERFVYVIYFSQSKYS